jgi:hypothetical protein
MSGLLTHDEIERRIYALSLLHRAEQIPSAEMIDIVGKIVMLLEGDAARFLLDSGLPAWAAHLMAGKHREHVVDPAMLRQPAGGRVLERRRG